MKILIIILSTLIVVGPVQAKFCKLRKYNKSCIGKIVIHKREGKNSNKYGRKGKIINLGRTNKGKTYFKIKWKGLRKPYYEPASHLTLGYKSGR